MSISPHSVQNTNRSNISTLSRGNMVLGLDKVNTSFKPVMFYFPSILGPPLGAREEGFLVPALAGQHSPSPTGQRGPSPTSSRGHGCSWVLYPT